MITDLATSVLKAPAAELLVLLGLPLGQSTTAGKTIARFTVT